MLAPKLAPTVAVSMMKYMQVLGRGLGAPGHAPRTTETPWAKNEVPASASGVTAMTRLVAPGLSTTASLKKMGKNFTCAMFKHGF